MLQDNIPLAGTDLVGGGLCNKALLLGLLGTLKVFLWPFLIRDSRVHLSPRGQEVRPWADWLALVPACIGQG